MCRDQAGEGAGSDADKDDAADKGTVPADNDNADQGTAGADNENVDKGDHADTRADGEVTPGESGKHRSNAY